MSWSNSNRPGSSGAQGERGGYNNPGLTSRGDPEVEDYSVDDNFRSYRGSQDVPSAYSNPSTGGQIPSASYQSSTAVDPWDQPLYTTNITAPPMSMDQAAVGSYASSSTAYTTHQHAPNTGSGSYNFATTPQPSSYSQPTPPQQLHYGVGSNFGTSYGSGSYSGSQYGALAPRNFPTTTQTPASQPQFVGPASGAPQAEVYQPPASYAQPQSAQARQGSDRPKRGAWKYVRQNELKEAKKGVVAYEDDWPRVEREAKATIDKYEKMIRSGEELTKSESKNLSVARCKVEKGIEWWIKRTRQRSGSKPSRTIQPKVQESTLAQPPSEITSHLAPEWSTSAISDMGWNEVMYPEWDRDEATQCKECYNNDNADASDCFRTGVPGKQACHQCLYDKKPCSWVYGYEEEKKRLAAQAKLRDAESNKLEEDKKRREEEEWKRAQEDYNNRHNYGRY